MNTYQASIRLKNGETLDYERLDKEMAAASFKKQRTTEGGREYHYNGRGSLPEVTTAAHMAAHKSGKEYSFTVIRGKKRN